MTAPRTPPAALDVAAIEAPDFWRVVERSGAVHGMRVEESQCPIFDERFTHVALSTDVIGGFWSGPSPMGAVVRYAEASRWDVAEILAPGEPTRAEALTALRAQHAADVAAAVAGERARAVAAVLARIVDADERSAATGTLPSVYARIIVEDCARAIDADAIAAPTGGGE